MIQLFTTYTLEHVQNILNVVLSILGMGWLFFISSVVKFKVLRSLRQNKNEEIPILETIVPHNVVDVFRILRIKVITPIVIISVLVILGIALTSFEGAIVLRTVHFLESCETTTMVSQAKLVNDLGPPQAISSNFEVDAMMKKRIKSGVPDGILVGQIPNDDRWRFNAQLDVDPYPCRGLCSPYKSAKMIQVNMNTTILHPSTIVDGTVELYVSLLPEVHAEYTIGNLNFSAGNNYDTTVLSVVYYNKTSTDTTGREANGALIMLIEEFKQGNFSTIGSKYINRMWTLRVPENIRIRKPNCVGTHFC